VDIGRRLVRLGLVPGCPSAAAEALDDGPVRRMPEQRAAEKRAYNDLVDVAKHAQLFQLCMAVVQAVALKALHLAEIKQYALLASVAISASNSWTLHTVSGTNKGVKMTIKSHGASVEAYCAFGASPESSQADGIILPIIRHIAATILSAESGRFCSHRRPRRGQPSPPPNAASFTPPPPAQMDAAVARVSGTSSFPVVQRGAIRESGAPDPHAWGVVSSSSSEDGGDSDARLSSCP